MNKNKKLKKKEIIEKSLKLGVKKFDFKEIVKILISIAISGVVTSYLQIIIENKIFPAIYNFIKTSDLIIHNFNSIVFMLLVSFAIFLLIPVFLIMLIPSNRKLEKVYSLTIYIIITYSIFQVASVNRPDEKIFIDKTTLIAYYIGVSITIYMLIKGIEWTYSWIKTSKEETGIDMAKLAFVWTVLVFIMGLIWKL